MAQRIPRAIIIIFSALACLCAAQGSSNVVRINVGGDAVAPDWRCDTGKFVTSSVSYKYMSARPIDMPVGPAEVYQSHRWTNVGDLEFQFPLPPGNYAVSLLFAEAWAGSGLDVRKFTVMINGQPVQTASMDTVLDIFLKAGGYDKPFLVDAGTQASVDGFLKLKLGRIPGKQNPMLSGIIINGTNAGQLIGTEGLGSCTAPSVAASVSPSASFVNSMAPTFPPSASANVSAIPEASPSTSEGPLTSAPSPVSSPSTSLASQPSVSATASSPTPSTGFLPTPNASSISPTPLSLPSAAPSTSASIAATPSSSSSAAPSLAISAPTPSSSLSPLPSKAMPSPAPSMQPICGKDVETEFKDKHFAHAVTGGPYVETDFNKLGYATVNLDGTNSHSHFQSDTENGKIVTYKWMWKDATNPLADAAGMVTVTTEKTTQNFPLGVTTITLLVIDQFCNSASESSTVTINSATKPGAYCYFYDYGNQNLNTVPLPVSPKSLPKPKYGLNVGDINFDTTESFGDFSFKQNTFAVRCVFYIDVATPDAIQYKVIHSGPVKIYHAGALVGSSDSNAPNQMTITTNKTFSEGLQEWQVMYLRPATVPGTLIFQFASGAVIPASTVRHDSGTTLPIITGMNTKTGSSEELVLIFGSSFVNGVTVKFGTAEATTVEIDPGVIQARVPAGSGVVQVTVSTEAGVSNGFEFTYKIAESFPIKFKEDTLKTSVGTAFVLKKIAVVKYGPDGRLYCGATNSMIYALTLNKDLQVTKKCEKNVFENWTRAVLGLGFNPTSNALKLYFTTSTIYWKENNIINNDFTGWTNGKVKSVTMAGANGCFNNDVSDVVTGLPVSNHDHAVQAIQFLPGGKMVLSVGGFTNGGISIPGDKLGGIASNPLAGAIVECPTTKTDMTYTSTDPLAAQIQSGGCKTYATGFRNTFGMELHTNGKLYASDNGPNQSFGEFSTDCTGGQKASKNIPDKLILVQPGKCHGHPSINRGLNGNPFECAFEDPRCVQSLIGNLQSSTNGVMEYRSNIFGDKMKGNLFLSKYTGGGEGRVSRVILNEVGSIAANGFTNEFWKKSGLSIVEGPRGEMIMSRVFKDNFFVLKPDYPVPVSPFFISVMPRKGPAAGGTTVLVTGHNFGTAPTANFGTKACTSVNVIDADSFTCVVPAGTANEQVQVTVSLESGSVAAGPGYDYWYF